MARIVAKTSHFAFVAVLRPFCRHTLNRMNIAWSEFTPWPALVGGLVIGAAATLYMLGNGRIAGISTLVGAPLDALLRRRPLTSEMVRLLFVAGLIAAPWVWQLFAPLPTAKAVTGPVGLVVAGLLVGYGTRMANGCTSGHGVCGLSRGSARSLVNVLVFMGSGVVTVAVLRVTGVLV
jgi:uncharacterized protein